MKITDERTTVKVEFKDIDYGEAFEWNGEVYMRIQTIWREDDAVANAVYVDNGEDAKFEDDELAEPLDTELIIRRGLKNE